MKICLNTVGVRGRGRRRSRLMGLRIPTVSLTIFCFFVCFSESIRLLSVQGGDISNKDLESYKIGANNSMARRIGGLGSSPPRCTSKCGGCTPCTPVHVPVPPGTPVTTEYYPEAWKCKCRNKFYIP
ncbi:EPIDERMAL PATTERNING FACTOR-like protein 6 [Salvia miltiorrhiza]|uniref:EPIDERMAL PATTERNING FACTOR-like protein 6 n=1 Tax=Salvia miltiorrhiza TaxID=226208 RepID=UPI0025AD7133|nr:EPIDERMAL PATTERNING FACTOR-like protein 6 [Salvia miltiorrhiza]